MNILVIQNRMGIGDMVIFLPYIQAVSDKYNSPVTLLVKESTKVETYAKKLRSKIDIESEFFDEILTSFEARQLDEDSEMIDDVAAKIILDSWLNNEYS